jgi:RNA polymerase sigma-70 factor (ECF subfamily)
VSELLDATGRPTGSFPTTRWSLVLGAGDRARLEARTALAELCQAYWYPIFAFIRRKGNERDKAEELTQAYFVRLLEKGVIAAADPCKGRFRSFLRKDCEHFLINEWRHWTARGRRTRPISIDALDAEGRYRIEPVDHMTPERLFDRAWAVTLLHEVLERLEGEYAAKKRSELFDHLKIALTHGRGAVPAATLAVQLGKDENAVNVAVHRLRKRYREILEERIAETIDDASEMDDEIRRLFEALRP